MNIPLYVYLAGAIGYAIILLVVALVDRFGKGIRPKWVILLLLAFTVIFALALLFVTSRDFSLWNVTSQRIIM